MSLFSESFSRGCCLIGFVYVSGTLLSFYKEPVDVRVPLDRLDDVELPPNLHVQKEYHRFHPETDTMFNGVSAFPKSSTLVTGLKTKKKYAGYKAAPVWH